MVPTQQRPITTEMDSILSRVRNLAVKPPITTNSIINFDLDIIRKDAETTRVIVHSRFPALIEAFLSGSKEAHTRKLSTPPPSLGETKWHV